MKCVTQVIEDDKQWWKLRNRSGQAGYVPYNILDVVKIEEPEGVYNQVTCATHICSLLTLNITNETLCGCIKLLLNVKVIVKSVFCLFIFLA